MLAPFLFLPVLAGADAWIAVALGQSVGGFAAWGFGLTELGSGVAQGVLLWLRRGR